MLVPLKVTIVLHILHLPEKPFSAHFFLKSSIKKYDTGTTFNNSSTILSELLAKSPINYLKCFLSLVSTKKSGNVS